MSCPLPNHRNIPIAPENSNKGLVFNKFFNRWSADYRKIEPGDKLNWITALAEGAPEAPGAAKRIAELAGASGGRVEVFETTGPFVTGMGLSHPVENGFLWHHTLGVPYLSGSSVKGMIRAWVEHWLQDHGDMAAEIRRLFGSGPETPDGEKAEPAVGNLIVFDALPVKPVNLYPEIITPHDGGWRISPKPEKNPPADWLSPNPIPFLAVAPGASFQFAIAPRKGAVEKDLDNAFTYLGDALRWIGAGAKTAVGFGRFIGEADRPLGVGDEVEISIDHPDSNLQGKFAKIEAIYKGHDMAKVSLKAGGRGATHAVALKLLKRLA